MFDRRTEGRWWDIGLDLVTGCTPVSPGCMHCWSAEKAHRAGHQWLQCGQMRPFPPCCMIASLGMVARATANTN